MSKRAECLPYSTIKHTTRSQGKSHRPTLNRSQQRFRLRASCDAPTTRHALHTRNDTSFIHSAGAQPKVFNERNLSKRVSRKTLKLVSCFYHLSFSARLPSRLLHCASPTMRRQKSLKLKVFTQTVLPQQKDGPPTKFQVFFAQNTWVWF